MDLEFVELIILLNNIYRVFDMKLSKVILVFFILISIITAQPKPYVLLISFDGFRWDYSNRGITPNLQKMKDEGVWASSLQPTYPSKTFPNHYSIITGEYIDHHGIIANHFTNPFTGEVYSLSDSSAVRNSKWYLGEPFWTTAERQGIISASYFWPGSEQHLSYRHPTYFEKYDHHRPHKTSVEGVLSWLQLPYAKRPHFITLYFHDTDDKGHRYGPNSPEVNKAIMSLDSVVGYIYNGFERIGMKDSINVIIVSDHGMTEIDTNKIIDVQKMLKGYQYKMEGEKPFVLLKPNKADFDSVYTILKRNENHYKVYLKQDMPKYFHYSQNSFIYPIIIVADLGWSLVNDNWLKSFEHHHSKGNHGYDNHQLDMHGTFIAQGPNFKRGYKTGTVWNIDIYPLLCKIFDIEPRSNIDGKLERIGFILK